MRNHHRQNREAYTRNAESLARTYNAIASADVLPGLAERLPQSAPGKRLRALDLGCGSGRDAFWLADSMGFDVVAVDAAPGMLAQARRLKAHPQVRYMQDMMPAIKRVRADAQKAGAGYDVFILSAVWMHLQPDERGELMGHMAALANPGALVYISLRHGPAPADRPMFENSIEEIRTLAGRHAAQAEAAGADVDRQGRGGVSWEYVALKF